MIVWLKLTNPEDESPILVNMNQVRTIEPLDAGCSLSLGDAHDISVSESFDEIHKRLHRAYTGAELGKVE